MDSYLTRIAISTWIKNYLLHSLDMAGESVRDDDCFSDYGVDSMFAVVMAGDIRDWVKKDISPTALYEFPTVNRLTDHICAVAGIRT